jgi:hypothetical protein
MPIEMECPNPQCRQALTAPDGMAGKQVRCPSCKTIFRVHGSAGEAADKPTAEQPAADAPQTPAAKAPSQAWAPGGGYGVAPPPVPGPPPVRPTYAPYPAMYPMHSAYYPPRTEGKTVASLVLGIIALVPPCFIYAVPGVVCGILVRPRPTGGRSHRRDRREQPGNGQGGFHLWHDRPRAQPLLHADVAGHHRGRRIPRRLLSRHRAAHRLPGLRKTEKNPNFSLGK